MTKNYPENHMQSMMDIRFQVNMFLFKDSWSAGYERGNDVRAK